MIDWVLSIITLIGTILNVKKKKEGFIFWIIANIGWIYYTLEYELYSQISIWVSFTAASIYGYITWRKDDK